MLKDLYPKYKEEIQRTAIERYPEECVFVITEKSGLREVNNISKHPTNSFSISKQDTSEAYDEGLLCVIHSHPDSEPVPSSADMTYQRQCGVPFGIVSTDGETVSEVVYFGDGVEYDLIDRPFIHGFTDCYSLIRDFYRHEYDTTIPDFPRDWEWWTTDQNMYLDNVVGAGFEKVTEPQRGDVFFAAIRSDIPNHAGIYLGDEVILHHLTGSHAFDPTRVSRKEGINRWMPYIQSFWRYK